MHREVRDFDPAGVVVDPMSALMSAGLAGDVHSMVLRLVDFLKTRGITALFTNLGLGSAEETTTQMQISSLIDTWLLLYNRESNGEHNRQLYVLEIARHGAFQSDSRIHAIERRDKIARGLYRARRRPYRIGPSRNRRPRTGPSNSSASRK